MLALMAGLAITLESRGLAILNAIDDRYWNPPTNTYVEFVGPNHKRSKDAAFAWDMAVLLSARAAAISSPGGREGYDKDAKTLEKYWTEAHGAAGYSVWPGQDGDPDRYYDDNEWIGLAQIEAFERTRDRKYLELARRTFQFVLSGETEELGGGIFWREKEKLSKNTCSNAPAALLATRLYLATKQKPFLAKAEELYTWTLKLRDTDHLYWDSIDLQDKIDKTKWTYNSALMIRAGLALHTATHKGRYLNEAVETAKAATEHWVDSKTGAIKDEAPFAHHLSEAFLLLDQQDKSKNWRAIAENAIDYAYQHTGKDNLFGHRWDKLPGEKEEAKLLYQASMARALLILEALKH